MKMRTDQEERLARIEEMLMDVFLDEADPNNWITEEKAREAAARFVADGGNPKDAARMAAGWKGERYWEKKNANQTMALISRIVYYRTQKEQAGEQGSEPDREELEAIAAAEKKVKGKLRLLKKRAA